MPFNGSGVFQRVRNWVADATAGIKIRADYHDAEDDGFAAGLTNCITRDGQSLVTQNIPWNSKRITGLQDPVNAQDAATKAYADTKISGGSGGGTMAGDLTITASDPTLVLNSTDATASGLSGQKSGKQRWLMRLGNDTVEGTANAGSDFDLLRYADDGTTGLGTALLFNRATGLGTVSGDPTVDLGIATKKYVDTLNATQQTAIDGKQASLGFTPVQQSGGAGQTTNKIYIGWSASGLKAQVDGSDLGTFVFGGAVVSNGRLAMAGDAAFMAPPVNTFYEPFPGAAIVGYAYGMAGGQFQTPTYFRYRYFQLLTTSWFTVGVV